MSLLGTMMVRAGLLSDEQLAAIQAASAERKLSFVEALLAHGFADEDSVVGFLHSKLMIPRVGSSVLDSVDRGALDRIPGDIAARHVVLPISSDETGNLTLAMVDPTDMKAVDAISAHTGAYLVRAVAPLRVIRSAIARHYGIIAPPLPALQAARAAASAPMPAAVIPAATGPVPSASQPAGPAAAITVPSAPVVIAPAITPPAIAAPDISAPSVAAPTAPVIAPTIPASGRAAIRPAAVLQPSAVVMSGMPRPAAVLPAGTFAPSPYGIVAQPPAPIIPPDLGAPVPAASPIPSAPVPAASSIPSTPVPAASFTPAPSVPVPTASFTPAPSVSVPEVSFTPLTGAITQPFISSRIAAPAEAALAEPVDTEPALAEPVDTELADTELPPVPVFSSMATLRPADSGSGDAVDVTISADDDAADTLTGGSRASDVVDIPLDDLETTDRGTTLIPGEPLPREPAFDAAKTGTWQPPAFTAANEIVPLSPEAFHRLLPRFATVKSRDEVTDLLLDFLAEGFSRVIMFVHVKGEIRGRDARGEDLLVEAVRQIRIPAGGPSVFSGVIERRTPYFGPMRTDTPIDAAFFSALGGVEGVILVLPVLLRDKVPLIVFASGSSNPVDPRSLHDLTHEVASSLERIIVLEKARPR